jgi:hypothetical protein
MFEYILATLVGIFIIYIFIKFTHYQKMIVESLTNNEELSSSEISELNEKIKSQITKNKDIMLIDKYKTVYEDYLLNIDELLSLECLDLLSKSKYNITDINNKMELKNNLNILMEFISNI